MSKSIRTWLIVASSLFLVGGIVFGGAMIALGWNFSKLSTVKYETNTYEITQPFTNISIVSDTADIHFLPSEDSKSSVVCYEQKNTPYSVTVSNDTLVIEVVDKRKWYEYIGITWGTPKVTIYLPNTEYHTLYIKEITGDITIPHDFAFKSMDITASTGDVENNASTSETVKITTDTGSISSQNISAGALYLSASTGKITLSGITCTGDITTNVSTGKIDITDSSCKNLISQGSTGTISLKNVIAEKTFTIERNTGNIKLDRCDAAELFIKTATGDVAGSLLSDKVFITETDTGRIDVPKSITGGRCEITTDTGDIRITIQP